MCIIKAHYQTSYIISNHNEKLNSNKAEVYMEVHKDSTNDQVPLGFKDVISSVESGDTIKILLSRSKKSFKTED